MRIHEGKVVFITGAARGIGRATAEEFARGGANVVACDLIEADLLTTADAVRDMGGECIPLVVDVRSQASLDAAVARAIDDLGGVDAVVANAGILKYAPFWETDEESWSQVVDVNLGGVWRTAKAVAPHLIERRAGAIVATGSVQSVVARKNLAAYTASKHGVLGLVRSMALELGPHNIRVNAVLPGAVHTPMVVDDRADSSDAPDSGFRTMSILRNRSILPPQSIARSISWLCSDGADQITGVALPVDAGSLILPGVNLSPVVDS